MRSDRINSVPRFIAELSKLKLAPLDLVLMLVPVVAASPWGLSPPAVVQLGKGVGSSLGVMQIYEAHLLGYSCRRKAAGQVDQSRAEEAQWVPPHPPTRQAMQSSSLLRRY